MVTIGNARIRVTISDALWAAYGERAAKLARTQVLPSGERREQGATAIQRGLVLSEAMAKLGNSAELAVLNAEEIDATEIAALARASLMERYLADHGRYDLENTLKRYLGGHLMPDGMRQDVARAEAYAAGALAPLSDEAAIAELRRFVRGFIDAGEPIPQRDYAEAMALVSLRQGGFEEDAATALADAARSVVLCKQMEIAYRQAKANMDGWQIEVVGVMPTQIGLCRMPS